MFCNFLKEINNYKLLGLQPVALPCRFKIGVQNKRVNSTRHHTLFNKVDENYMISAANPHDFEGQFQKDYSSIDHQLQGVENETNHTGADVKILNNS